MMRFSIYILLFSFFAFGSLCAYSQGADGRPLFAKKDDVEGMPKSLRESQMKMQIEKEKKDHDEMISRGEEVRRLSEQLERSFSRNGRLSDTDLAALDTVERNAKKIRSELGGDDGDEKVDELLNAGRKTDFAVAVDTLKNTATNLADELNKTTRFTISANAIQSSNIVMTIARFLRVKN